MRLFVPITPLRAMTFDVLGMPSASELQRMHDMLRFVKISGGKMSFGADGGMVIEIPAPEVYAFRATATARLEITLAPGQAYMVNESPVPYAEATVELPAVEGEYAIYLRHTYGFGADTGTWGDIEVCLSDDLPSEEESGRIVARNFIVCTVEVLGSGDAARIDSLVQNWRAGDVWGYAPYFAPEEGPAP